MFIRIRLREFKSPIEYTNLPFRPSIALISKVGKHFAPILLAHNLMKSRPPKTKKPTSSTLKETLKQQNPPTISQIHFDLNTPKLLEPPLTH